MAQLLFGVVLGTAITLAAPSFAGPCSAEIDIMRARIGDALDANAASGRQSREGVEATMHRQPTPRSMAAAEEALGDLSQQKVDQVREAMLRAIKADDSGDHVSCARALEEVDRALVPPARK